VAVADPRPPARRRIRSLLAAAVCLALLTAAAAPARADEPQPTVHAPPPEMSPWLLGLIVAGVILLPSDIGLFVPGWGPDFALGWSYQYPFTPSRHHRLMVGLDLIPTSDSARWRMRGGYRFGYHYVIAGLTAAYARVHDERSDPTWSPEIGLRLGPDRAADIHLLARAEIPVTFDGFRGVALLLGWDMQ
jgi:hypothetical protein